MHLAGQLLFKRGFNRDRDTDYDDLATLQLINGVVAARTLIDGIAVALPNSITRSVRRGSGFVQRGISLRICGSAGLAAAKL